MSWLAVAVIVGTILVFLSLVSRILQLFKNGTPRSTVRGMEPSDDQQGNLNDIEKAGSVHQFLMGLHKEFGPIASFWWGKQQAVSIASPELFKQHHHVFDRAVEVYRVFEPVFTRHSIVYTNGAEGKLRRQAYDSVFKYDILGIYYDKLQKVADEITSKWEKAEADDHLPLGEHMSLYVAKAALIGLLGDAFEDEKEAMVFKHSFDLVWNIVDKPLEDPTGTADNSNTSPDFQKALATMKDIVARAVKERERHGEESRDFLLIDAIIGHHPDDEERRFGDAITYVVGGLHTSDNLLTWCIYYLCLHEECQERLYQEIVAVLGTKDPVTDQSLRKLKYLRHVLDETLRCTVMAPIAARYSDEDIELGGHKIYSGTPVIHALGVTLMDEHIWPNPTTFDPDRFSEERSRGRPTIAFSPFGFAGHRKCPGYRLAYVMASIMMVSALQKFRFMLVPGQDVKPVYGLVTHPKEEIWIKVARRV
ncbi:cytochrome P450 20A1-like isoform X2 [Babylonia areolata]|uniref:cytochrome P450 20A1-like isoform X2 n=1 Tax=Babylonia areolata TaxID=304850 RepID=UPI003FD01034